MTGHTAPPPVLGDIRIPWVVLLDARLDRPPPTAGVLAAALADVAASAGWPPPGPGAVRHGARRDLLAALATASDDVVRIGVHEHGLVVVARHDLVDGLGMLTVLGRLIGTEVQSSARGVDAANRAGRPGFALLRRMWEVGVRPQARVAGSTSGGTSGDAFAEVIVEGSPRTADLVHAGARAVSLWNQRHARRARRVSVAVGVSTVGGSEAGLADHSAFLRLRCVEQMTVGQVRAALTTAPLELGGFAPALSRPLAAAARLALRAAGPRLGSTLLVSHLGPVNAAGSLSAVAFYPVTGGGSGISLGAATVGERTTLTLRARATQHDDEGLQQLLALVVEALTGPLSGNGGG